MAAPEQLNCTFRTVDGREFVVPRALLCIEANAELRAQHAELHALLGYEQEQQVFTRTCSLPVCRWFHPRCVVAVAGSATEAVCAVMMRREGRFEAGQTYCMMRFMVRDVPRFGPDPMD